MYPSAKLLLRIKVDDSKSSLKFSSKFGVDITDVVGVLTGVETTDDVGLDTTDDVGLDTTDDVGLDTTDDVGTDIIPTPFVLSIDSFKNGEEKLIFLTQSFFVPIAMYIALTIAINIIERNILL